MSQNCKNKYLITGKSVQVYTLAFVAVYDNGLLILQLSFVNMEKLIYDLVVAFSFLNVAFGVY